MPQRETSAISLNVDQTTCEIHGQPGEYIFDLIRTSGDFYEASLLRSVHSVFSANENGLFIDVGANIGNHTVYFAKVMGAEVLAVEPIEENLDFLKKNLQANDLTGQVKIATVAAWNANEKLHLNQSVQDNSGTFRIAPEGEFETEGKKLDDLVGNSRVSLIKIDVEGAEQQALEGALATIKRWRPMLIIEAHGAEIVHAHRSLLEPLDYHLVNISGRSDNYVWVSSADEATRTREEFSVVNHRREQRKLNASLAKQKSLLEELRASLEALPNTLNSSGSDLNTEKSAEKGLQSNIESGLQKLQESITALPISDPNVTLQLTQLAVEIGRQSAAITENNQRLKRISPRLKDSAKLSDLLVEVHSSIKEGHAQILQRLDAEQLRENLSDPIATRVEDAEASLQQLSEALDATHKSIQHADKTTTEQLDKVLDRLEEDTGVVHEPQPKLRDTATESSSKDETIELSESARERLFAAYQQLSDRFERHNPGLWSSEAAIRALQRSTTNGVSPSGDESRDTNDAPTGEVAGLSDGGTLKLLPRQGMPYRQRVRVGIASMPGREATLAQVLYRIAPQADEVFVYLNNMESVPEECSTVPDNVYFFTGPDLGDRGKFRFLEDFNGYYLTVDDDIDYSRYHVVSLINAIERYNRKAIVGWHGSIFQEDFQDFYDPKSRKVLTFGSLRGFDTPVHLLGTGVCGFHTDSISLDFEDFQQPNMADVYLAIQAKNQNIPMLVIAHEKDEAKPLQTLGSISDASLGKKEYKRDKFDVRKRVTQLVQKFSPWPPPGDPVRPQSPPMKVAVVGRTNPQRWKKGGILKSCLLTRQMLLPYGCKVHLADIIDGDPIGLEGFQPDVVMVYVGDPERPDFKDVHRIVEHHADRGIPVLVNLSEDSNAQRTRAIAQVMERWHARYTGLVKMMAFTPSVQNVHEYRNFAENIVTIPKTLTFEHSLTAEHESTTGIFVGDVAKLSDPRIVGPDVEEHIRKLREALPEAKIYGVQQYKPRYEIPSGIDAIWPHLPQEKLAQRLSGIRLMVNFAKYATYEMVPVETAGMGVPVLSRNMPQSLNTALGLAAASFTDPLDLAFTASSIYRDPVLWRQYSRAGMTITRSQDFDLASAQMYLALKRIATRHQTTTKG